MRALTVRPSEIESAQLATVPEPSPDEGAVLVETIATGVCGTDREIVEGHYGEAPPGARHLILGHESLGRVLEAPDGCGLQSGDLVVGIVRRPDPLPCSACAAGQYDMCRNGRYTERGIKALHGFGSERFRIEPEYTVRIDPQLGELGVLLEPASVVAKAWDHVERIGQRAFWAPRRVLVTGAGPIGLLATLMAVQRGYEVHVLDRITSGPKPQLVHALGANYHTTSVEQACAGADVILECTGVPRLVFDAMQHTANGGIVCLTGLSTGGNVLSVDAGELNRRMVLENDVVVGSVNANRGHYELAAESLAQADREWLQRLITRRLPPERWQEALQRDPLGIKTIIEWQTV